MPAANPSRQIRPLRTAHATLALALLVAGSSLPDLRAEVLREWQFAEGWTASPATVRGDPASRLTAATPAEGYDRAYRAAIPALQAQPVWLEIDLTGWEFPAGSEGALSIGFGDRSGRTATPTAAVRIYRIDGERVGLLGDASGRRSSNSVLVTLPNPLRGTAKAALHVDRAARLFGVYLLLPGATTWTYVGAGVLPESSRLDSIILSGGGSGGEASLDGLTRVALRSSSPGPVPSGTDALAREQDAAPFFSAAAWAIMDADTGEVLASRNGDRPHKTASVTKSMTTHVICRLAQSDPTILDEMVTFPESATSVVGSKLGLKTGESIRVRDALYAFMVRSGNDAGNALSDHFNHRFANPEGPQPSVAAASRRNFIAEMNREAARIGMSSSAYRSAFGDGGADHDFISTAHDLLKLAVAAMADPLFRDIAATASFSAEITRPNGSTYRETWTQDNPLRELGPQDGVRGSFTGIKGGFTGRARYSFLGYYDDGERRFYTVVIGSPTREISRTETKVLVRLALENRLSEL